ncbi:MAG: DUF2341 domain-containing protein [Betaproteobacteria bacterium HGW-Betaproteobacteria-7]|jgi:biopolymer transport protein ExbB|nr:MAG: DUF2341 domain-containing protein [Betaproteobacteria bacterium HGW-Betaproteobacteria-7]
MKKRILSLLAVAGLLCAGPAAAQSFAPDDWEHARKTVIDTTADGVELKQGAAQVPIAVRLHSGNFPFAEALPDGSDLRVSAADGKTPLSFHLEKFDAVNELAVIWLQQPKLVPLARSDAFHLHWGNDKAAPASDAKASYDKQQTLVLHFSESAGTPRDATAHAHHPADFAAPRVAGPLGDALRFAGGEPLVVPAAPALKLVAANGFTFTAWVKPAVGSSAGDGLLFAQGEGGRGLSLGLRAGKLTATADGKEIAVATQLLEDTWQHVVLTVIGGKLTLYVDGLEAVAGEVALADVEGDLRIGGGFRGDIDEVTLAATARSSDYLLALYGSQQPDTLMLTSDAEPAEELSYMNILLSAVTIDGWIVIIILGIMFVISVLVMVGKTHFLGLVKSANNRFIDRFRQEADRLLDPDTTEAKAMQGDPSVANSPIYRLYAIGIQEMAQRFRARGREDGLSGASLDAIRASMDAGMVRENQRLNSQIVLLTIAISGGPFLGLLGTVVGVMITFAAIAAAGDVNVNAIAPGIAAALVATVAGLAVAIPALFGYNWLASQIKNVSADVQVFADEFVTRAAELYSR